MHGCFTLWQTTQISLTDREIQKMQDMITQEEVTKFYDDLVFPSNVSNPAYARLIPDNITGMMVGDFGCGQSLFNKKLNSHCPAPTFLDIATTPLRAVGFGLRINADICDLPIRSEVYDIITCIGVIHHLPNMKPAFEEISRVLKKGGLAIIGVYSPTSFASQLRKFHERLRARWMKTLVLWFTELLIFLKNSSARHQNRMTPTHVKKRAQDLLQTPLVHYLSIDNYAKIVNEVGLKLVGVTRISSMIILKLMKR